MSFALKNNTDGNVEVDGVIVMRGTTKTVPHVGPQTIAAVNAGKLVSTPALTGLTADADLVNNLTKLTNTTGTAATVTNGAATIAAITDVATAANAIATLAAAVEGQRLMILNLMNQIELERSINHNHR